MEDGKRNWDMIPDFQESHKFYIFGPTAFLILSPALLGRWGWRKERVAFAGHLRLLAERFGFLKAQTSPNNKSNINSTLFPSQITSN